MAEGREWLSGEIKLPVVKKCIEGIGTIYVRKLSSWDEIQFLQKQKGLDMLGKFDLAYELVAKCLCDSDGVLLFGSQEEAAKGIGQRFDNDAVNVIFEKIMVALGMLPEDADEESPEKKD